LECILNQVDPQFDAAQGVQYRLSILLCQDGFSFLVTDADSQKILKLLSYKSANSDLQHRDLDGWPATGKEYFGEFKNNGFTEIAWQRVDIAIASRKITVAPEVFLKNGEDYGLMSAAHSVSEDEEILTEPVFDLGPVIAIAAPRYLAEYGSKLFPAASLHCAPAIFVKGLLREHSNLISRQVFINVYHGYFEIAVIQGLRLIYLNSFRYLAPSDVLYYVIFVLEQLGFVPSEENVTLMGEISENEIIYNQLKMYCGSLQTAAGPDIMDYGETFNEIALHRHYTLFNIPLCE